MISEGSCDTEDWSDDAEDSACITGIDYILKYIKIQKLFQIVKIFLTITVFTVFCPNNCGLCEHKRLYKKKI